MFGLSRLSALLSVLISLVSFSQTAPQEQNPLFKETMGVYSKVVNSNNLIGNFPVDSGVSLPVGINKEILGVRYIIAVDSIRFRPNEASCSAYMAIGLPGVGDTIAFAAKNIGINPKGVLSGAAANSKLMLVSEHVIRVGPKISLVLKNDNHNYIEWNCNGFQAIHLKGYFKFSGTMLEPDVPGDTVVTASFEIHTTDIHNFIAQVSMLPFHIKGINDLSFTVTDATVDMSDISNAPSMIFPQGYQLAAGTNTAMWTGFYIRQFTIKLPKELSKKNQGRTELTATNFVIDNSGISGLFGATNVLAPGNSDMGGWQFSIEQLNLNVAQNHLNGGGIAGQLKMPAFENNGIVFNATIHENTSSKALDYNFIVSPQNNLSANVLSATVDLYPTSKIIISRINQRFEPKADLTGQIKFSSNAASTAKLDFQNMIIEAHSPYLTSGIFNYVSASGNSENKVGKFPISINQVQIVLNQTAPNVYFNVGLNFMQGQEQGFAAAAGFRVMTKFEPNIDDPGNAKWKFDRVRVEDINLDVQTQAFLLKGYVVFRENDPVYGSGFAGGIKLNVTQVNLDVTINAIFGAKDTYKYFYVDGALALPTPVMVCCGVGIYKFMGGLYYHMSQPPGNENNLYSSVFGGVPNYVPNPNISLGFKAGVTLGLVGKDDTFNADVALEIQFNSQQNGGGISLIKFSGDGFLMTSIAERQGKRYTEVPVGANVTMQYDFNNSVFHSNMNVGFKLDGVSGVVPGVFHVDPAKWYYYIGRPAARGYVNIQDIATVKSYFMVGTQIEPMAPLPYQIANAFGNTNSRDYNKLSSGRGICMGAELNANTQKEYGFDFFTITGNVDFIMGFDAMLNKYAPEYVCSNTASQPGFKGWYLRGQMYAYFDAHVRVKGEVPDIRKSFDFEVFSGSAAAYLYAELIKPSYVEGAINCHYEILNAFSGNFQYNFQKGTSCG